METIEIGGIAFRIKRSARKSICIRVNSQGEAEILAPRRVSLSELSAFAEPYAKRVGELCVKRAEEYSKKQAFQIKIGDELRCLGELRRLMEHDGDAAYYDDTAFYVPRGLSGDQLKNAVMELYKLYAKSYISHRVEEISAKMGLHPTSVRVNSATSHWATCSAKNTLNFTWFTIMARPEAIDYIIIHELCHMKHFNHSPRFWAEVARYCPNYKSQKEYLRGLWHCISLENWK